MSADEQTVTFPPEPTRTVGSGDGETEIVEAPVEDVVADEAITPYYPTEELVKAMSAMLPPLFEIVDVSDQDEQGVAFVTWGFVPPTRRTSLDHDTHEQLGTGTFHLTFRVKEEEVVLADYVAE